MRTKNLALGFLCGLAAVASTAGAAQPQVPAYRPMRFESERHPEIMKAIRKLQATRADLAAAARDYGGHRSKAVQLVDQAIAELRAGLEWDRHH